MKQKSGEAGRKQRSLTGLGEAEMEVLHHVWSLERATVAEVHERILRDRRVAYTTVMTIMKKLAGKGFLELDASAATYVYSAARSPDEVRGALVEDLVEKVFHGSRAALVQTLVGREEIPPEELDEIKDLIREMTGEGGAS